MKGSEASTTPLPNHEVIDWREHCKTNETLAVTEWRKFTKTVSSYNLIFDESFLNRTNLPLGTPD